MPNLESVFTLIKLPAKLFTEAVEALKDGWQMGDFLKFLDEAMLIPGFIKAIPEAGKRIKEGLSFADLEEVELYVEEQLNIPNEKAKKFAAKLVAWAGLSYELFEMAKDLKTPETPEIP